MKEERDFFKKCFNIVAKLDVQNENQLIAKEVVLDEVVNLQQENQQLKEELEKIKQPTVFIDTEDMEERYGEGLYMDYLKEENKQLKEEIKELREVRLKAPTAHEIDHLDCWRMSSRQ